MVDKLHVTTWQGIRDSPVWRNYLTTYAELKDGVRGYVSEKHVNWTFGKTPAKLFALEDRQAHSEQVEQVHAKPKRLPEGRRFEAVNRSARKPKVDHSSGHQFKAKISCHFCGKTGHYQADCWKKNPEKRPFFTPKNAEGAKEP